MCVECAPMSKQCVECGEDYCAHCAKHPTSASACGFCDNFICFDCVDNREEVEEYGMAFVGDLDDAGGHCHMCGAAVCGQCSMRPDCCKTRVYCPDCKCPDANGPTGPFPLPVRNEAAKRLGLPRPIRCIGCDEAVCSDCVDGHFHKLSLAPPFGISKCSHCGQEACGRHIKCEMDDCRGCGMLACEACMEDGDPSEGLCGRCVGRAECELCEE